MDMAEPGRQARYVALDVDAVPVPPHQCADGETSGAYLAQDIAGTISPTGLCLVATLGVRFFSDPSRLIPT